MKVSPPLLILRFRSSGKRNDGGAVSGFLRADDLSRLYPIHLRHEQVHEDKVRLECLPLIDPIQTCFCDVNRRIRQMTLQHGANEFLVDDVVFHDQNLIRFDLPYRFFQTLLPRFFRRNGFGGSLLSFLFFILTPPA